MNWKNARPFYLFVFYLLILSCGEKEVENKPVEQNQISIYDFDNVSDKDEFDKLNLDKTHPNLLNPQISDSDFDEIMVSWTDLHNNIAKRLDASNFDWQIDDKEINILHKFYFDPNGKIKKYFFRIMNNKVTDSKREEYANLISGFASEYQLPLEREAQYAQCGKTKYMPN